VWYYVREVRSDAELILTEPFAGGDLVSPFTIARIAVQKATWDARDHALEFRLGAQVPAELREGAAASEGPQGPGSR
jgi:hypothetical protein